MLFKAAYVVQCFDHHFRVFETVRDIGCDVLSPIKTFLNTNNPDFQEVTTFLIRSIDFTSGQTK